MSSKKICVSLGLLIVLVSCVLFKNFLIEDSSYFKIEKNIPIVAITQIVDHPILNAERESLLQTLENNKFINGKNIRVVFQSAQGNIVMATQIAKSFLSLKPKVVICISTPSAQSVVNENKKHNIPILFSAVSDPVEARIVPALSITKTATGVSDCLPPESQIELVKSFHPNIKRLGVIYNPAEINSVKQVQKIIEKCTPMGITVMESPLTKTSEASSCVAHLANKVEAIYIPNDNTAVSAMQNIIKEAQKSKIPVYAGDTGSVECGAIATYGYNRAMLGRKLGIMAVKILNGETTSQIPIEYNHQLEFTVNLSAAKKFGVSIPEKIKQSAKLVGERT